jgi:choline dehydrogenase-like flavoprotein
MRRAITAFRRERASSRIDPGLTDSDIATLRALARSIAPAAIEPSNVEAFTAALLRNFLVLDAQHAARLRTLIALLGSRAGAFLITGSPVRVDTLATTSLDGVLHAWQRTRLPFRRTAFQAVRRLILASWYGTPAAHALIGYLPHPTGFPWEGALPGAERDDEPVARVGLPAPGSPLAPTHAFAPARSQPGVASRLTAQVCVIGSGAGGAVAACRLAEAGHDVVLLEEGPDWKPSDSTDDESEMVKRLYAEGGARATEDLSVMMLQGRCLGGGTTVNWLLMLRTPDHVLEEWQQEHGTEGMSAAEMSPIFDEIEREVHATVVPDDAHSPNNVMLRAGARALGWNVASARINTRGCVRAGTCGLGCRHGAKQGAVATYLARAHAAGARIITHAHAGRIEVVQNGVKATTKRVHAKLAVAHEGSAPRDFVLESPIVVVAGGGVGTPALLQRSGLGSAATGRYLRLHPTTAVVGRYSQRIYGAAGIPQSVICDEFMAGDDGYGFWLECPPLLPALASVAVPGFGAAHAQVMQGFPHLGSTIVLVRDGRDRGHSSGDVRTSRAGATRIRYRLAARDAERMRDGIVAATRAHLAAGATEAWTLHDPPERLRPGDNLARIAARSLAPNRVTVFSAHVNGTCRMGVSREHSACTPDGQLRGSPGIYVMDGSLLPTAPGVNPQETIMALSTVLARRLAAAPD